MRIFLLTTLAFALMPFIVATAGSFEHINLVACTPLSAVIGMAAGSAITSYYSRQVPMLDCEQTFELVRMDGTYEHPDRYVVAIGEEFEGVTYRFFAKDAEGKLTPHEISQSKNTVLTESSELERATWRVTWKIQDPASRLGRWTRYPGRSDLRNQLSVPTLTISLKYGTSRT